MEVRSEVERVRNGRERESVCVCECVCVSGAVKGAEDLGVITTLTLQSTWRWGSVEARGVEARGVEARGVSRLPQPGSAALLHRTWRGPVA
jgi:hypothetical protein